jgi:hypothetical protein
MREYLNLVSRIYRGKSYTEFTYIDIMSLLSIQLLYGTPSTKEEVQSFVKKYFGIDNYELKTGTYKSELLDTDIIIKCTDDKYRVDYPGRVMEGNINLYNHKEIKNNYLVVYYDYSEVLGIGPSAKIAKKGITKIYLKLIENNLTIKKIEYSKI